VAEGAAKIKGPIDDFLKDKGVKVLSWGDRNAAEEKAKAADEKAEAAEKKAAEPKKKEEPEKDKDKDEVLNEDKK